MVDTILGIDLRPGEVRLAQVSRRLMRLTATRTARAELPLTATPVEIATQVADLIAAQGLLSQTYVLGLPAATGMLRRLTFPFTSLQKIRQVLPFELETQLPVAMDTLHVDLMRAGQGEGKSQHVLAAALPDEALAPVLEAFVAAGVDPDIVTFSGSALNDVAQELGDGLPPTVLLLDIGPQTTELLYRVHGQPVVVRSLRTGAEALAQPYADGDSPALSAFCREIMVTILGAQGAGDVQPEQVLLSGIGALDQGLCQALARCLKMQVSGLGQVADAPASLLPLPAQEVTLQAPALGLALGAARQSGFNFRSGKYASTRFQFDWKRQATFVAATAGAVFLAWCLAAATDIWIKKKELARHEAEITALFKRIAPDIQGNFKRSQYVSIITSKIHEIEQNLAASASKPDTSVVELMRQVSGSIPPDMDMTVNMVTMDDKDVQISATSDQFKTVEEIKNQLIKNPDFQDVTIKGAKADASGKGVSFQLGIVRRQSGGPS